MVEINGDNTFYPNRVTFWVFAVAYHLLSDAPFQPISSDDKDYIGWSNLAFIKLNNPSDKKVSNW